jgi:acetolactate synthase-1/2/3 large subunit
VKVKGGGVYEVEGPAGAEKDLPLVSLPFADGFEMGAEMSGSDLLIAALELGGVTRTFAYPGGASLEIHQSLLRSSRIRNILCRHEQGEVFAAEGFAKCSGQVGVAIATSGPGATNLITGIADAFCDSVPLLCITGQVPQALMGLNSFQVIASSCGGGSRVF